MGVREVRVWRGLTRFDVVLVPFVLSAGNGNWGQAMRRAGHARLARALGRWGQSSEPVSYAARRNRWPDSALAVHAPRPRGPRRRAVRPREEVFISPLSRKSQIPKCSVLQTCYYVYMNAKANAKRQITALSCNRMGIWAVGHETQTL